MTFGIPELTAINIIIEETISKMLAMSAEIKKTVPFISK